MSDIIDTCHVAGCTGDIVYACEECPPEYLCAEHLDRCEHVTAELRAFIHHAYFTEDGHDMAAEVFETAAANNEWPVTFHLDQQ